MINHLVLVVDVGGTNTRFALAERNSLIKASSARFLNADFANFLEVAQFYCASLNGAKPSSICIAIAGPVSADKGELTNGNWVFEKEILARSLDIEQVYLLNDLVALGYALDVLPNHTVRQISGGATFGDQSLVAGIATGFNVSICHAGHVIAAELGHASLPSSIIDALRAVLGEKSKTFNTVESLFSGRGLAALHLALGFGETDPEQITGSTIEDDAQTVLFFAQLLGLFCKEMVFQYMPFGGLYLNGSVVRAIFESEAAAKVVIAEVGKVDGFFGRSGHVPLFVIIEDYATLYGCARYAKLQN
jgi:glucokinase|tara:strand:+ start:9622 stop:10536 length:915 start_codon:yes stop_codon:yes gene_type:complete